MMQLNKKGLSQAMIQKSITSVIFLAVLFLVLAELLPTAQDAGDTLNASGVPLGGLFVAGGVIFLIIMAGVLIAVVTAFIGKSGR